MHEILTTEQLKKLHELAHAAVPKVGPLKGQGSVAIELKNKGYSIRDIAHFLTNNGIKVSSAAVGKFFKNQPTSK